MKSIQLLQGVDLGLFNTNEGNYFNLGTSGNSIYDYDVFVEDGLPYQVHFNNENEILFAVSVFCDGICANDPGLTIDTFDPVRHKNIVTVLSSKAMNVVNGFRINSNDVNEFVFSNAFRESIAGRYNYRGREGFIDVKYYLLMADENKYPDSHKELMRLSSRSKELNRKKIEDYREAANQPPMMHLITTEGRTVRDLQEKVKNDFYKILIPLQKNAYSEGFYNLKNEKMISIFLQSR